MSNCFKGILSVLALSLSFSVAAQESQESVDDSHHSFTNVVIIGCAHESGGDHDFDVTSVTPSSFNAVRRGDDCALALSKLTNHWYKFDITFNISNNGSYSVYTLERDMHH